MSPTRPRLVYFPTDQIICGNCVEIMERFPNDSIDLVVTSPPYDNLRDYRGFVFDFESIAYQLYQTIKQGGVLVWIVGDATIKGSETGTSFRQVLYFKEIGFNLHDTMIYSKVGFQYPATNRYHQTFEYMFVLSKGKPKTFNPIKDRKNKWEGPWGRKTSRNKDGSLTEKKREIKISEYGQRYNVWYYSIGKGNSTRDEIAYKHPAIFPEKLAHDHILSWSNEKDIILDPMCGSGTTCKEAKKLNRQYIGIDISQEYCNITQKRLEQK
ncbi:hypothetical protein LCGC14_2705420 [marine sediment metagenome]|uniref:site-specific DNA-methyltransferase (cytosine-N(4)-specific) n=1 Tax=marine sediment metagenome TaxID=412755 RepID=A0A0F9BNL4_9ZZZZ